MLTEPYLCSLTLHSHSPAATVLPAGLEYVPLTLLFKGSATSTMAGENGWKKIYFCAFMTN